MTFFAGQRMRASTSFQANFVIHKVLNYYRILTRIKVYSCHDNFHTDHCSHFSLNRLWIFIFVLCGSWGWSQCLYPPNTQKNAKNCHYWEFLWLLFAIRTGRTFQFNTIEARKLNRNAKIIRLQINMKLFGMDSPHKWHILMNAVHRAAKNQFTIDEKCICVNETNLFCPVCVCHW